MRLLSWSRAEGGIITEKKNNSYFKENMCFHKINIKKYDM